MAESKKPPRHTHHSRSSMSRVSRQSVAGADPGVRLAACETGLAKATGDIAALRSRVESIVAELDDLRATIATSLARLRKVPPPLPREGSAEAILVDEREVTLESIRPKRPR
jgi:hypothetical protein